MAKGWIWWGLDFNSLERLHVYLINTNEKLKNFKKRPRHLIQDIHALDYQTFKIQKLNHKITSSIFKSRADF